MSKVDSPIASDACHLGQQPDSNLMDDLDSEPPGKQSQIPEPQKLCKVTNVHCFMLPSGVICYAAVHLLKLQISNPALWIPKTLW